MEILIYMPLFFFWFFGGPADSDFIEGSSLTKSEGKHCELKQEDENKFGVDHGLAAAELHHNAWTDFWIFCRSEVFPSQSVEMAGLSKADQAIRLKLSSVIGRIAGAAVTYRNSLRDSAAGKQPMWRVMAFYPNDHLRQKIEYSLGHELAQNGETVSALRPQIWTWPGDFGHLDQWCAGLLHVDSRTDIPDQLILTVLTPSAQVTDLYGGVCDRQTGRWVWL